MERVRDSSRLFCQAVCLVFFEGILHPSVRWSPARFPAALPEFFTKLLTDEGDIVYDPFAGSNATGAAAERLDRRWLASENVEEYLAASKFRFEA